MQNFIFISPNFPTNYWQFCRELKNDGMNVLGIGDQPYDELKPEQLHWRKTMLPGSLPPTESAMYSARRKVRLQSLSEMARR